MSSSRIYRRLLGYVRPYVWPRFAIAIACMLIFGASNGIMPFLVRSVFDDIFASKNVVMLYLVPLVILLTFVIRGLANYGNQYFTEWVAQKVITDLRDAVNQRVQYLPLSYFNRTPTGTIVSLIVALLGAVAGGFKLWQAFFRELPVQMIQVRNLNIDPDAFLDIMPEPQGKILGTRHFIAALHEEFPQLVIGSFSHYVES